MFGNKKPLLVLAATTICLLFHPTSEAAPKWRTAYYANSAANPKSLVSQSLSSIPWEKYTHVIQSSIMPTFIGGVPGIDTCTYSLIACEATGVGNAQAFVDAAHKGGAKALVSVVVGYDNPGIGITQATDMTLNTSPANVDKFVKVLTDFLNKYGYDGVDIDWEGRASTENVVVTVNSTSGKPTATITYVDGIYDDGGAHLLLKYLITVTNPGADIASSVVVADALPVGLTFASSDKSSCKSVANTVSCDLGDLAPGASVPIVVYVDFANEVQFPPFVRKLRAALGTSKVITVFGGGRPLRSTQTDAQGTYRVYEIVDQINFGTYDNDLGYAYTGRASTNTWFNTAVRMDPAWKISWPVYSPQHNPTQEEDLMFMQRWEGVIPLSKLGLVLPFYGYVRQAPLNSTSGVTEPNQTYYLGTDNTQTPYIRSPIAYRQLLTPLCAELDSNGNIYDSPGTAPDATMHCANGTPLRSHTQTYSQGGSSSSPGLRGWVPYYFGTPNTSQLKWNDLYKAPYVAYSDGNPAEDAFVSYTDPRQIHESVKLAKENSLGGMGIFSIEQEFLPDQSGDKRYPLTMAMSSDLGVTLTSDVSQVDVNGQITYTVVAWNNGPAMASGVKVVDTLPAGLAYVSASSGCVLGGATVTCTLTDNLDSAFSASFTITVKPTVAFNSLVNSTTVSGDDYDPNAANNSAQVSVLVKAPDLIPVSLSAKKSGSSISVSDTVKNQGNASAGAFTIAYYLSPTQIYDATTAMPLTTTYHDTTACMRTVTGLAVGVSNSATKACYKPAAAKSGVTYYLLAIADSTKQVTESSEINNVLAARTTLRW